MAQAQKPARISEVLSGLLSEAEDLANAIVGAVIVTVIVRRLQKLTGRQRFVLISFPILISVCVATVIPVYLVYLQFGDIYAFMTGSIMMMLLSKIRFGYDYQTGMGKTLAQKLNDYLWDRFYPEDE